MTPSEIRAAVNASAELQALAAAGDHAAIAAALSAGRFKIVSHFASERGILDRYPGGPIAADALLAKLEAFAQSQHSLARIVGRALKFLGQPDGLDIGAPATQAMLSQLVPAVITEEERTGLQAMATVPAPVHHSAVTAALEGAA